MVLQYLLLIWSKLSILMLAKEATHSYYASISLIAKKGVPIHTNIYIYMFYIFVRLKLRSCAYARILTLRTQLFFVFTDCIVDVTFEFLQPQ